MATNKYYISAGLQPHKDQANPDTGTNTYRITAGLPKVVEVAGVTISVTLGTISIAGLYPEIEAGTTVDCTLGAVTIAGLYPEIEAGTTIAVSLGTLAIAGHNVTVDLTETVNINCTLGTLTIVGQNPGIEAGTTVDVSLGAVEIAGYAVTIGLGETITGIRYVRAAGGNNGNSGESYALGWATLAYTSGKTYGPGAIVYGDGAFAESWTFAWSGTDADNVITLADYGNETFQVNQGIDYGAQSYCVCDDVSVDGATIGVAANGGTGIVFTGGTVENCTEFGVRWYAITSGTLTTLVQNIDGNGTTTGDGIYLGLSCVDCTVTGSQLAGTFARQGLSFTSGSGFRVEYLVYTGSALNAIDIEASSGQAVDDVEICDSLIAPTGGDGVQISDGSGTTTNVLLHHNNIVKATAEGQDKGLQFHNATGVVSYANVIEGWEYNLYVSGTAEATSYNDTLVESQRTCVHVRETALLKLRNAIVHVGTGGADVATIVRFHATATINSDFNFFFSDTRTVDQVAFYDGGGPWLNFAGWQAAGYDANSQWADPLFLDQAGDDYSLATGSPAIVGGEDLGDARKWGLDPATVFPDDVRLLDRDIYGWGRGAYVWPVVPGPYEVDPATIGIAGASRASLDVAGQTQATMAIAGPSKAHVQTGG